MKIEELIDVCGNIDKYSNITVYLRKQTLYDGALIDLPENLKEKEFSYFVLHEIDDLLFFL